MGQSRFYKPLFFGVLLLASTRCLAFDVGDPSFSFDGDKTERLEFFALWMQRDLVRNHDRALRGTAAGGPTSISDLPPRTDFTLEEDYGFLRYTFYPNDQLAGNFDIGYAGEAPGGEDAFVIGGAFRALLHDGGSFQVSSQIDAHFVPEYGWQQTGVSETLGPYDETAEIDYYEYGISLLASYTTEPYEGGKLMVYGGPRLSRFRAEHSAYADFSDSGDRIWISGIDKEESPFSIVLGSRMELNELWSLRIESRLVNEESLSVGFSMTY